MWLEMSLVIGNGVGSFMIKKTMGPIFFISLSIVEFFACCLFCFIQMPVKIKEAQEDKSISPPEKEKTFYENLK